MTSHRSSESVAIKCSPGFVVSARVLVGLALAVCVFLILVTSGWLASIVGSSLAGGYLYARRMSRASADFSQDAVIVKSPMFDRTMDVANLRSIAFSGDPHYLRVVVRDGGFTTIQVGRNMFEGRMAQARRVDQTRALQQLYAHHDIDVSDDVASAGFGWTRRSPMIHTQLVKLGAWDTMVVVAIIVVAVVRTFV